MEVYQDFSPSVTVVTDYGFYVISEYKDKGINLPKRKTKYSAGYDFEAAEDVTINPGEVKLVPTGVKAKFPEYVVLKLYPRSSTAVKKRLMLANNVGIIDSDYFDNPDNEGHIMFAFYNFGDDAYTIKKGEAIGQGIFELMTVFEEYDKKHTLNERRTGGFGSTDK